MNEDLIISLAIDRPKRERFREAMLHPRKRIKILDSLNHNPPLDARRTTWFSSFKNIVESINVDSHFEVYLLSSDEKLDGQIMTFEEAIKQVPFHGWGTIIGISPDLAIYYGETCEKSAIIKRK